MQNSMRHEFKLLTLEESRRIQIEIYSTVDALIRVEALEPTRLGKISALERMLWWLIARRDRDEIRAAKEEDGR